MSNAGVKVYFYFYFSKIISYCSYFMIGLWYKFTILVRVKMVLILKCTFQAATKIAGINFDKIAVERLDRLRNKMHLWKKSFIIIWGKEIGVLDFLLFEIKTIKWVALKVSKMKLMNTVANA
jgi:hypothetical protein